MSSYAILSERLEGGGYALLSGITGAIELINDELYELLVSLSNASNDAYAVGANTATNYAKARATATSILTQQEPVWLQSDAVPPELLSTYLERGHFTELDYDQERLLLTKVAENLHQSERSFASAVIVPELDCNYRCVYCFERAMQSSLRSERSYMTEQEVDAVFHCIDELIATTGKNIESIALFGGEPLMLENLSIIEHIVKLGRLRGIRFSAISNGHDLDGFTDLLGSNGIASVQVTIDGPKHLHDARRIALDGSSSFDRIIRNTEHVLKQTDVNINIRINLDDENHPHLPELLAYFAERGWLTNNRILVNVSMVYQKDSCGASTPTYDVSALRQELNPTLHQYPSVTVGSAQTAQTTQVLTSLVHDQPIQLRSSYCAANSGMYVFLPNGKISCCWELIGEECSQIGSYTTQGLNLDVDKTEYWFNRSVAVIPQCLDCRYCLVCGGGCAQNAEFTTGDINTPNCDSLPETFAWVLADAVEGFLQVHNL